MSECKCGLYAILMMLRLHAQAQFLAGQSAAQPAARVTRVSRRPPQQQPALQQKPPEPTYPIPDAAQPSTAADRAAGVAAADQAEQEQPLCPSIPGILSDVQERVFSSAQPPGAPTAAAAAAGAFPAAVHRKQSKVGRGTG